MQVTLFFFTCYVLVLLLSQLSEGRFYIDQFHFTVVQLPYRRLYLQGDNVSFEVTTIFSQESFNV